MLYSESAIDLLVHLEDRHKGLLRDLDRSDGLHALLALFLLLEQLALTRDIAAVALGKHVLAQGLDRLAGDDLAADGSLHGDLKHLARDIVLELFADLSGSCIGVVGEEDEAQRVDDLAVQENVELDELRRAVALQLGTTLPKKHLKKNSCKL